MFCKSFKNFLSPVRPDTILHEPKSINSVHSVAKYGIKCSDKMFLYCTAVTLSSQKNGPETPSDEPAHQSVSRNACKGLISIEIP
ncbi:hypothetical protein TNCV_3965271 [Trichonephila clavipes]|nr:hypothetical protein TNCV_3965271 [Trichonephila clavipes]